ncbi:MAG: flagellar protein FlgN [Planctomycetota bacterium]|nr:MAG: flagellar protein FlgN [Planctomycetota bacterium]
MYENNERVITEALLRELRQELALYRKLLALAQRKREALVSNDLAALHVINDEEQSHSRDGMRQRQLREDLLRRLAEGRGLSVGEVNLAQVQDWAGQTLRGQLQHLGEELRAVVQELQRCNDGNQLLLRTALGLVREMLGTITGSDERQGYDRSGHSGGHRGSGGLMNYRA